MNKILLASLALLTAITFNSCVKSGVNAEVSKNFTNGVMVVEEGPFVNGSGELTWYSNTTKKATNNQFALTNSGSKPGNIVQSYNVIDFKAYVVVNNANKIWVLNRESNRILDVINGFYSPRYIIDGGNGKLYVSEWGITGLDGAIKVVDKSTLKIIKSIPTGPGAEQMVKYGNIIYTTLNGGLGNNDSMALVNIDKDEVTAKVKVGPNPTGIVLDKDNNFWILCRGQWNSSFTALTNAGTLVKYNTFTNKIDKSININSLYSQPNNLCIGKAGTRLYYTFDQGAYYFDITAAALQPVPFIYGNFYGLNVDDKNKIIYTADAKDFASAGVVRRYHDSGGLIDSFATGIIPSSFYIAN